MYGVCRLVVAAVICIAVRDALCDARSDYQELFGKEASRVAATSTKADDLAFAEKLLESAAVLQSSEVPPGFKAILYEQAYEFAARSPDGPSTALKALDLLVAEQPARKTDCQVKRIAVFRARYLRARGAAKKQALSAYIEALTTAGDMLSESGSPGQAAVQYRTAQRLARYHRLPILAEIRRKLAWTAKATVIEKKAKSLRLQLQSKPEDTQTREKLILLCVTQQVHRARRAIS